MALDLGRDESIAWASRYTFWRQGNEGKRSHAVQEREEGEDGKGKLPFSFER